MGANTPTCTEPGCVLGSRYHMGPCRVGPDPRCARCFSRRSVHEGSLHRGADHAFVDPAPVIAEAKAAASDDETVKAMAERWVRETTPPRLDGHRMKEDAVDEMIALGIGGAVREAFAAGARSVIKDIGPIMRELRLELRYDPDHLTEGMRFALGQYLKRLDAIARQGAPQPEAAPPETPPPIGLAKYAPGGYAHVAAAIQRAAQPEAARQGTHVFVPHEKYRDTCVADIGESLPCRMYPGHPVHAAAPKKEER